MFVPSLSVVVQTMGQTLIELVPKLKTNVSGLVDWSYLSHANCVLLECRRVLSNAYIFAYFMFDAESFLEVWPAAAGQRQ
jgi:Ariadne domain